MIFLKNTKFDYNRFSCLLYLFGCALVSYFIFIDHPLENYLYSDMNNYYKRTLSMLRGDLSPMNTFHPTGLLFFVAIDELFFVKKKLYFTKTIFYFMCILIPLFSGIAFQRIFDKKILWPIAAIIIFHYPLISFSGFLMAEIPSSFFITLLLLLASFFHNSFSWIKMLTIGLVFVLSMAFKGNVAFFVPAYVILLVWYHDTKGKKTLSIESIKSASKFILSVFIFLLIYGGINKKFFGHFHPFSSVGGVNFYMAKCPNKKMTDLDGRVLGSPAHHQLGMKGKIRLERPFHDSMYYYEKAFECLLDDPKSVLYAFAELTRMFDGVVVWPPVMTKKYTQLIRYLQNIYALLIFPGLLIFLVLLFRDFPLKNIMLTSLVLGSLILPFVFIGDVRYRSVFDPIFLPGALLGWISIGKSEIFKWSEQRMITSALLAYFIFCIVPVSYNVFFM